MLAEASSSTWFGILKIQSEEPISRQKRPVSALFPPLRIVFISRWKSPYFPVDVKQAETRGGNQSATVGG